MIAILKLESLSLLWIAIIKKIPVDTLEVAGSFPLSAGGVTRLHSVHASTPLSGIFLVVGHGDFLPTRLPGVRLINYNT